MQKADGKEASRLAKDSSMGVMLDGFGRDYNRSFPGCRTLSVETGNILGKARQMVTPAAEFWKWVMMTLIDLG